MKGAGLDKKERVKLDARREINEPAVVIGGRIEERNLKM
jgi:hypothetical protein